MFIYADILLFRLTLKSLAKKIRVLIRKSTVTERQSGQGRAAYRSSSVLALPPK